MKRGHTKQQFIFNQTFNSKSSVKDGTSREPQRVGPAETSMGHETTEWIEKQEDKSGKKDERI
jgi:hypothetical protein